jgi:mannose-6-phosphate isomerase-like protein (cupin superfamily)
VGASPRPLVVHREDRPEQALPGSKGSVRVMIGHDDGGRYLMQRVFRYDPGLTPNLHNESSEDVMFVVEGLGTLDLGTASFELAPGTGAFAPAGVAYTVENPGPHDLVIVSVLAPPPGAAQPPDPSEPLAEEPIHAVLEEHEQTLTAGPGRSFRELIGPRHGCRNATQFVGYIEAAGAPPHRHTYEEVIHILDGAGAIEIEDERHGVEPGTSILLPPGVPHRLEATGREILRLLGVISPAGSPASKEDLPG